MSTFNFNVMLWLNTTRRTLRPWELQTPSPTFHVISPPASFTSLIHCCVPNKWENPKSEIEQLGIDINAFCMLSMHSIACWACTLPIQPRLTRKLKKLWKCAIKNSRSAHNKNSWRGCFYASALFFHLSVFLSRWSIDAEKIPSTQKKNEGRCFFLAL